ncbi:MAG: hypothetical protein EA370_17650 [Wenzhouxiangella sp.]|nr:MAG: hypothetical protein EA370_17650 [Wenzhouxiangella sp.]
MAADHTTLVMQGQRDNAIMNVHQKWWRRFSGKAEWNYQRQGCNRCKQTIGKTTPRAAFANTSSALSDAGSTFSNCKG